MRRPFITSLTAAVIAAGGIFASGPVTTPTQAAMPVPARVDVSGTTERAQPVAYVCRRVWRGRHRGWRRHCHWRPNRFWRPRYYYAPRYRPYRSWRRSWRRYHRW